MNEKRGPQESTVAVSAPSVQPATAQTSSLAEVRIIAGRYLILTLLGEGGMGTVYKARDVQLEEVVALKMLRRELVDNPNVLERFRREVKLARRVTHRNVARTFDISEHEGEPFLTMEFVQGESLARVLSREPRLPVRRVLEIAISLCEGLAAAHDVGVVHRDLKPDNVLIANDGRVVVTDFGIARAVEPGASSRTSGGFLGTPSYMAPEQVEGAPVIDGRADVYALGVILFELFTGDLPFTGNAPYAVAAARLLHPPPDPRIHGVSDQAAVVILRCLAREPADRFASVREVADALRAVPIEPTPPPVQPISPGATLRAVETPMPVSGTRAHRTVAVLPMRNGGPPEDDHLADGLTEDLIDHLSMTEGLRVRPPDAVAHLKGSARDAREVGAELGVDAVVAGSIRKAGDTLRIAARVLSVADGFQLWAKRFDRPAADVLAVTDEVAKAIAKALLPTTANATRLVPTNPKALELYFRARQEYHRFDAVAVDGQLPALRAAATKAVELFDEALALAPDDPMILSGYVLARARTWFFDADGAREQALDAATRAVELAPLRGESYVARATVELQRGDLAAAIKDARHALSLSPTLADAHELIGRLLSETGPAELGIHHTRSAAGLDPAFRAAQVATMRVHELSGDHAEADRIAAEIVEKDAAGIGWTQLCRTVWWRGDAARAKELFEHPMIQMSRAPSARELLRMVLQPETSPSAIKLLTTSLGTVGATWRSKAFLSQTRTEVSAAKGKIDDAMTALAEAVDAGLVDLLWLDGCPLLRSLRDDPRFPPLRARVAERAEVVRAALSH